VRPQANPLPLGFLALAAATLLVGGLQLGWLEPSDGHDVALVLLAFVFPAQLVASIVGYQRGDIVAGTAMGILAGTWLSVGVVMLTHAPGSTSDALGLYLLLAAVAMLVPAVTSATLGGLKLVATVVLTTVALRFAATGLFELTASSSWKHAAGLIGVVLCAIAVAGAALVALQDA